MPVELTITETQVVLDSSSAPGPAGPGVPTGGTAGQVLTKDSGTDYDTSWQDSAGGGGGAPTTADYLVGTTQAGLSAEIVVGTSPGGELGGTWAAPTVDATHSGSSHAAVQAAAEATAAAALSAHLTDTSDAHDASAISSVAAGGLAATDVQAALNELDSEKAAATHAHAGEDITSGTVADARIAATIARDSEVSSAIATSEAGQVRDGDAAGGVLSGTYPNPGFAADMATQAELDAHITDSSAAHAASAVSADSTTLSGTGTDVQAVLEEIDNLLDDHSARHENGGADEISIAGLDGTPVELTNHLNDTSAAHAASAISADSTTLVGTGTDVQAVLEELDNGIADHLADTTDAHDATAISFSPAGTIAATTVQAAIEEVASEAGGGGGLFASYALLEDQKAQATAGGTITANTWLTRDLNTEVADPDGIVSISSNQFTLQAGTYLIRARAPAWFAEQHKIRLRNITDGATTAMGRSNYAAGTNSDSESTLSARVTIAGAKAFEIQHLSRQTRATDGMGVPTDTASSTEVYCSVEIYLEA